MIEVEVEIRRKLTVTADVNRKPLLIEMVQKNICYPVKILDQDDNVIATVTSGGTYHVLRFDGIKDSGPPYSNSIVDPG